MRASLSGMPDLELSAASDGKAVSDAHGCKRRGLLVRPGAQTPRTARNVTGKSLKKTPSWAGRNLELPRWEWTT